MINEKFRRIYLDELTHLGEGLPSKLGEDTRDLLFETMGLFEAFVIEGQKRGEIKRDIDYQKIAIIFIGILKSYLCFWMVVEKSSSLRDSAEEMYEIFMNGLGA